MNKTNFFAALKAFAITLSYLLLMFFSAKLVETSHILHILDSIFLLLLTWYLLKRYQSETVACSTIVLGILVARYIGDINWLLFGFKSSWNILWLDLIDLVAIVGGLVCYLKNKWYVWCLSVALAVGCQIVFCMTIH